MMAQLLRLVALTLLVLLLAAPGRHVPGSEGPTLLGQAPATAAMLESARQPALPDPPTPALVAGRVAPLRPATTAARLRPAARRQLRRTRPHLTAAPRAPPLAVLHRTDPIHAARTSCSDTQGLRSFWRALPPS